MLKQGYVSPSHFYKSSMAVITIWLTITKYQYLKWQLNFSLYVDYFFPLSLLRFLPDVIVYMCSTADVIKEARTAYPLWALSSVVWCPLRCSFRLYHQLFVWGLMSYLRCSRLLACSGVQHISCCVFVLLFFFLCILCCQFLWIVHFSLPIRYSLTFIKLDILQWMYKPLEYVVRYILVLGLFIFYSVSTSFLSECNCSDGVVFYPVLFRFIWAKGKSDRKNSNSIQYNSKTRE